MKSWWYALGGEDAENWHPAGSSREEAIGAGRDSADGGRFTIARASQQPFPFPCADEVVDLMVEHGCDNDEAWGDDGPPDIDELTDGYKAALADFRKIYDDWKSKHAAAFPTSWNLVGWSDYETFDGGDL